MAAVLLVIAASAFSVDAFHSPSVRALFSLDAPESGPFPSDLFTVADPDQNTGLLVNLPKPDCRAFPSDCEDIDVLNLLDGFNLQPRISIPFDAAIDVNTVTSQTVFLLRLGDTLKARDRASLRVGINQIVWDAATNTLHVRSDESLDQQTRYALVVTRGVRDPSGAAVEPGDAFQRFRRTVRGPYKRALLDALQAARRAGVHETDIAVVSAFTTQSFSHIIERMRDAIRTAPAPKLDFNVGPGGACAVFEAAQIQTITKNLQTSAAGPLTPQSLANLLTNMRVIPGAVGTVAFGKFRALDFTTRPSGHIAPIPTRTGKLAATGSLEGAFNLWLPAGKPPADGWPVAIYGTGSFGHKDTAFAHAAVLNSHGVAVLAINLVGRGGGPLTTMTVQLTGGTSMTFAAPGLGYDANRDGTIEAYEPRGAQRPRALLHTSGPIAQAAAQRFALVRGIQAGVDVDGNGAPDLDASRIYYFGQSFGAMCGMLFFAYEPAVRAAVFNVPAATVIYNISRSESRPWLGGMLAARMPSMLNSADGLTTIDGVTVEGPFYNENLPLRDQPPRVNIVPGATDIQKFLDRVAWAAQITNTVAFAPLLRRAPPAGVPARPFVFQFARSDQTVVNPGATEIIRAGGFADRVLIYRHDLNFGKEGVPANPHAFLSAVGPARPNFQRVALGAQHQIGTFFESNGTKMMRPDPGELWEWPIRSPLPEDTFFLPRPR